MEKAVDNVVDNSRERMTADAVKGRANTPSAPEPCQGRQLHVAGLQAVFHVKRDCSCPRGGELCVKDVETAFTGCFAGPGDVHARFDELSWDQESHAGF